MMNYEGEDGWFKVPHVFEVHDLDLDEQKKYVEHIIALIRNNDPRCRHVRMVGSFINDMTFMKGNTHVETLIVPANFISDLSPLEGNATLAYLDVTCNSITDISPLKGNTTLTHLYIEHNNVTDISPLKGNTTLTHLYMNSVAECSMDSLRGNTTIEYLYVNRRHITNLSFLNDMNVKELRINAGLFNVEELDMKSLLCNTSIMYLSDSIMKFIPTAYRQQLENVMAINKSNHIKRIETYHDILSGLTKN